MFRLYKVVIGLEPDKTLSNVYNCFVNTRSQFFFTNYVCFTEQIEMLFTVRFVL